MKPIDKKRRSNTPIIVAGVLVICALAALAFVPLIYGLVSGGTGVRTEGIEEAKLKQATTPIDGTWEVSGKPGANLSSAGFSFHEILPGEEKITSGSTRDVSGTVEISAGVLRAGEIVVDVTNLTTDSDRRDTNVRNKILHTDTYPEAVFAVTQEVDVSQLPEDGSVGQVELTGEMTIHGVTQPVTHTFDVVRSGENVIVAGDVPINREDYGVQTPDFVAAKIDKQGEVNIRLKFEKK
ncbi:YceI family protein [Corynebacterium mayonis]|uniref:YceI family protein n=1 Tax=Corynebacterium mayonis TaxID=3062461 RepID=UPI0031409826